MARRARPPRKTDGVKLEAPRYRGNRWSDQTIGQIFLHRWLPSLLVTSALLIVGGPIMVAVVMAQGYELRTFVPRVLEYIFAPGGVLVSLAAVILAFVKDRNAKHLAGLQIEGGLQTQAMADQAKVQAEQAALIAQILATQERSVSLDDKHSAAILEIRSEMSATRTSVAAGATSMQQLQTMLLQEYSTRARLATGRTWAVPPAVADPTGPQVPVITRLRDEEEDFTPSTDLAPEMPIAPESAPEAAIASNPPHIIPVSAHVTGTQALSQPASTRTPATQPGERTLTPLDPEWMDEALSDEAPDSAGLWGRTPPPSEGMRRFLDGETGTYPADEIERLAGKRRLSSEEEQ